MIAEFRKKPSLARLKAAEREKSAELDRIVREEVGRAARMIVGVDPGMPRPAVVWYNPRTGIISNYVTPPGVETMGDVRKREKRRRS